MFDQKKLGLFQAFFRELTGNNHMTFSLEDAKKCKQMINSAKSNPIAKSILGEWLPSSLDIANAEILLDKYIEEIS